MPQWLHINTAQRFGRRFWWVFVLLAIATVLVVGAIYFFAKADWQGQVTAFEWVREWDKERYQPVGGRCWYQGCAPARAYALVERSETHHYNRIPTGETCTKIGNTRSCTTNYMRVPVSEIRVYYTVNDWRLGQTMKVTGTTNRVSDLYWPDLKLNTCSAELQPGVGSDDPMLGCERPAQQRQWFYVHIQPEDSAVMPGRCAIQYGLWTDTRLERAVSGSYWIHQHLMDCHDLRWQQ